MKAIYDSRTDTLTIILKDTKVYESDELKEGIIMDYDKNGKVVSIEILSASKYTDNPYSMSYELSGRKTV